MCGRYNAHNLADLLVTIFGLDEQRVRDEPPRYNIAPSQFAPVIRLHAGTPLLEHQQWGITPNWTGRNTSGKRRINARMETADTTPSFAESFAHRRCLVPANGYYEWTAETGSQQKQPWHIHLSELAPFLMAGLWQHQESTSPGSRNAFAILTQPSLKQIAHIHDRMPVIIPPEKACDWLAGDPAVTPVDVPFLADPVSTRVNSPRIDEPALLQPLPAVPAPRQGTLF